MKKVPANGIEIAFDEFGDEGAPVVLLIMGLATQLVAWPEPFCKDLAGRGFRVIRFDNRDVGLSTKLHDVRAPSVLRLRLLNFLGLRPSVPYTLSDMAADTVGLLDALGIDAAHLVGASMGGMIGQRVAIEHPDRVRSLTSLMSTTGNGRLPGPRPHVTRHMFLSRPSPGDKESYLRHAVRTLKLIGSPEYPTPDEQLHEKISRSIDRAFYPQGFMRQLAAILHDGDRSRLLESVRLPVLVIHGSADPLVPVECGRHTAECVPGAVLEIIEGMGHDLPDALLPQLAELIARHAHEADAARSAGAQSDGAGVRSADAGGG